VRVFRAKSALLEREPNWENGSGGAGKAGISGFSRMGLKAVRFFDAGQLGRHSNEFALDCGAFVREQEMPRPVGADLLMELAQSSGLTEMLRQDDLQHVISEAFQGRSAIVQRAAFTDSAKPPPKVTGFAC